MSKVQLFAIFAAIALVVLLLFAPHKPSSVHEKPVSEPAVDSAKDPLELAVRLVKEGEDPMKGIMMIREILQKDSTNIKAHFILGEFSMQSGQWEKAKQRFLTVIGLDSTLPEAYLNLARTEQYLGDTVNALFNYQKYITLNPSGNNALEIQDIINELKK